MKRILTVDDSRAIRLIVAKQAREMGFEVVEAEDGEQGLAKLKEGTFDVVILDVTMPVLDGPGMLAKMRRAGRQDAGLDADVGVEAVDHGDSDEAWDRGLHPQAVQGRGAQGQGASSVSR